VRDRDVRAALLAELGARHIGDDDTRIVQEMGLLRGQVRVDVAVINGELAGYEIKSPADTLQRLPQQQMAYSRVFDRVWLVTTPRLAEAAMPGLPEWWGILSIHSDADEVRLSMLREADINPAPDPAAVAALLWREEALEELVDRGLAVGLRSKPRRMLVQRLTAALPSTELCAVVRQRLKRRDRWSLSPSPQM
jgi:hypothetical protein